MLLTYIALMIFVTILMLIFLIWMITHFYWGPSGQPPPYRVKEDKRVSSTEKQKDQ